MNRHNRSDQRARAFVPFSENPPPMSKPRLCLAFVKAELRPTDPIHQPLCERIITGHRPEPIGTMLRGLTNDMEIRLL
jgi:hypothetical protein